MIMTNTETIPGKSITTILGIVRGNTVRAKHVGKDILAGLKGLVGGEISQYTELIDEARQLAIKRMLDEAHKIQADAVINVRFATSMIAPNMAELLAYGTAVKLG